MILEWKYNKFDPHKFLYILLLPLFDFLTPFFQFIIVFSTDLIISNLIILKTQSLFDFLFFFLAKCGESNFMESQQGPSSSWGSI